MTKIICNYCGSLIVGDAPACGQCGAPYKFAAKEVEDPAPVWRTIEKMPDGYISQIMTIKGGEVLPGFTIRQSLPRYGILVGIGFKFSNGNDDGSWRITIVANGAYVIASGFSGDIRPGELGKNWFRPYVDLGKFEDVGINLINTSDEARRYSYTMERIIKQWSS